MARQRGSLLAMMSQQNNQNSFIPKLEPVKDDFTEMNNLINTANKNWEEVDKNKQLISSTLGQVQLNDADYKYANDLAEGIKERINKYARRGDFWGAMNASKQAVADLANDQGLKGRIRNNQLYQEARKKIWESDKYSEDTKRVWDLENKYNYTPEYDEYGREVQGKDWTESTHMVEDAEFEKTLSDLVAMIAPSAQQNQTSSTITNNNPDKNIQQYTRQNTNMSRVETLTKPRIYQQVLSYMRANPKIKEIFLQKLDNAKKLYNDAYEKLKTETDPNKRAELQKTLDTHESTAKDYNGLYHANEMEKEVPLNSSKDSPKVPYWFKAMYEQYGGIIDNFAYRNVTTSTDSQKVDLKDDDYASGNLGGTVSGQQPSGDSGFGRSTRIGSVGGVFGSVMLPMAIDPDGTKSSEFNSFGGRPKIKIGVDADALRNLGSGIRL